MEAAERLKTMATTGENNGEDVSAEAKFGSFRLQLSPACKMADKEKLEEKNTFIYLLTVLRLFCKIYTLPFCNSAAKLPYLAFVILRYRKYSLPFVFSILTAG